MELEINYETVAEQGRQVLDLAAKHNLAPEPFVYEVLFEYAHNPHGEIGRDVGLLLENVGELRREDLRRIHSQFVLQDDKKLEQQERASARIEGEMNHILELIRTYMESGETMTGTLDETATVFESGDGGRIRQFLQHVLKENVKMRDETQMLVGNLEQSREQLQSIRSELADIREQGNRDPLTNVGNRRQFDSSLTQEIQKANAAGEPLCLVLADLDHFKQVNDSFGHLIGDEVLKFFATLLVKNLKGGDWVSRYGGEEFAVILPSTSAEHAASLMDQIRQKFEESQLFVSKNKTPIGQLSASFGIAEFMAGETARDLIERADKSLYAAKEGGRNQVALAREAA